MTTQTLILAIAAAAGLGLTTAAAQERGDRDGPFADGVLTRAEAQETALARFDRVDANQDGFVSESEREAAKARRAERAGERGGERQRRGRRGGRRGEQGDRLALIDANDDGFVSRDEARDAALARFDAADADGDGEVTREEVRGRRGERGGRGRRGGRR